MPEFARASLLYQSPSVAIGDWDCHPHDRARGPEEHASRTQVVLTRRGAFVRHVRGEEVVADCGQALFFNLGETYRVSHPVEGGDRCTTIALAPPLLREALRRHERAAADREPAFAITHSPIESGVFLLHRRLVSWLQSGRAPELAADEIAFDIVDAILARACGTSANRRGGGGPPARRAATRAAHRDCVEAARLVLVAKHGERVRLEQIAREVSASPYHLSRLFRQHTGLPMHRYLTWLRLRAALEGLGERGVSLTEAALAAGFYDHSHFTNAFRREFGLTPSEFRRSPRLLPRARRREIRKNLQA